MAHNRKIVLSGVSLTKARLNPHSFQVGPEVMDDIEKLMMLTGYLENAPFKWVGLILRYGLKNEDQPHYQRISEKHGDLPLAIELDTHDLQHASHEELKDRFMVATLKSLVDVGMKYGLPYAKFADLLAQIQSKCRR